MVANPHNVRVVYTASDTPFGRLIRKVYKSRVSHCMIQYDSDLWGGTWIAEATFPFIRKVPAERARHHVVAEFECLFDPRPGLRAIRSDIGSLYDVKLVAGLGWIYLLWRFLKIRIKHPWHSVNGSVCSEWLGKFFKASNLKDAEKITPELLNPRKSMEYNVSHPELFKRINS